MGRQVVAIVIVLCGGLVVCSTARADLTAFWRNNPITPQAIADDPALAGMQSWSVMVANTEGSFRLAGLRAVLPEGHNFYRNPLGENTRPSSLLIGLHPALEFDTYITSPHDLGDR